MDFSMDYETGQTARQIRFKFIPELMWFAVLVVSTYGTVKLIDNNWRRYNENPTVVAIQKNYREWNVTFPAATFCFIDNLGASRAKQFIYERWNVEPGPGDEDDQKDELQNALNAQDPSPDATEDDGGTIEANATAATTSMVDAFQRSRYKYYLQFLRTLVNVTYENLNAFRQYVDDNTVNGLNVKDTIFKVMRTYGQNSTFYTDDFNDREFILTPTEMGMCYVHGGQLADYITLSPDRWSERMVTAGRYSLNMVKSAINGDVNENRSTPKIRHHLQIPLCSFNTLCYARTEGMPSDIRYYIHSPYEIPDASSPWFLVKGRMGRDVSFMVLETTVSSQLYDLSPSQRQCRFMHESTHPHQQVYSFNLCRMQCRKELAYKLCGCAPYFYAKEDNIPVCSIKGLSCLSWHSELLITLINEAGEKIPCNCLPHCRDSKYTVDKDVIYQWTFPAPFDIRFRWAIEKSNKIRIQRDVIFSFQDLVGSFGGIAALFLGCSILSFVEIVYFFTLRLYWFIVTKK